MPLGPVVVSRAAGSVGNFEDDADESSLWKAIGQPAMSGLGMVGNLLDLPGSMVRDTLALENPLDQLLSPLSGENRTSGRDLLYKWGVQRKNKETGFVPFADPGEFGRDVAGFGAEVLLDPLTYLTFGGSALTQGGKTARNAGLIDDVARHAAADGIGRRAARSQMTLDDLITRSSDPIAARSAADEAASNLGTTVDDLAEAAEPVGRAFGVGLPFGEARATFGGGRIGELSNAGLDLAGKAIRKPFEMASDLIPKGAEYSRFRKEAVEAFGDQAREFMPVMQARSRVWAKETGKNADEWFAGKSVRQSSAGDVAGSNALSQSSFDSQAYPQTQSIAVEFPDGRTMYDQIKGLNPGHALWRAKQNWPDASSVTKASDNEFELYDLARRSGMADLDNSGFRFGRKEELYEAGFEADALRSESDELARKGQSSKAGEYRRWADEIEAAENTFFHPAWHGSPHSFDKFTTDAIGTGEGAQVYGWGLYFAENQDVAKHYKNLAKANGLTRKDLEEYFTPGNKVESYGGEDLVESFDWNDGNWSVKVKSIRGGLGGTRRHATQPDEKMFKAVVGREPNYGGKIYNVDLAPGQDEYLVWDKPLSEQSEKVQKAVEEWVGPRGHNLDEVARQADSAGKVQEADWARRQKQHLEYQWSREGDSLYDELTDRIHEIGESRIANEFELKFDSKFPTPGSLIEQWARNPSEVVEWAYDTNQFSNLQLHNNHDDRLFALIGDVLDGDPQKVASEALQAKGVRGIKFADKGSRMAGPGQQKYQVRWSSDGTRPEVYDVKTQTAIDQQFDSFADADEWIAQFGDEGKTYNYVIFDGADVAIKDILEQRKAGESRGAVEFSSNETVIHAFESADISTLAHEAGHVFRRDMPDNLLKQAEESLNVTDGQWTRAAEEAFASGFERYLRDGQAPTSSLAKVFDKFKEWLSEIYRSVAGTPLAARVSPQLKNVFDTLIDDSAISRSVSDRVGDAISNSSRLDRLEDMAMKSAPVRFGRMLFDPAVGGKFDQVAQEVNELAYADRRSAIGQARQKYAEAVESLDEPYRAFEESFGPQLRSRVKASDIDPRDLDGAIDQVVGIKLAEWNDPVSSLARQYRQQNLPIINALRGGDVDYAAIPGFDLLLERFRNEAGQASGHFGGDGLAMSADEFADMLLTPNPKPTRSASNVISDAEDMVRRDKLSGTGDVEHSFDAGDVVIAADRGNYGYAQRVGPRTTEVMFRNPETGQTAVRIMPNAELSRAFEKGSVDATERAEEFAQLMTRKVFDDIVRHTAETGNVDTAFSELLGEGVANQAALGESIETAALNMQAANRSIYHAIESKGGNTAWLQKADDDDFAGIEHFPRYVDAKVANESSGGSAVLPRSFGSMKGRAQETREIPTTIVNRILREKRYRGDNAADRILHDFREYLDPYFDDDPNAFNFGAAADFVPVKRNFSNLTSGDFVEYGGRELEVVRKGNGEIPLDGTTTTMRKNDIAVRGDDDSIRVISKDNTDRMFHKDPAGLHRHAAALEGWIAGRRKQDLYTRSTPDDFLRYQKGAQLVSKTLDAVHEVFNRYSKQGGDATLSQAFKSAGMKRDESLEYFAEKFGMSIDDAEKLTVPTEVLQQVKALTEVWSAPGWARQIGETIDGFNRQFKTWVTVPFPGFAMRNLTSGQHVNISSGLVNGVGDLKEYGKAFKAAHRLQKSARESADKLSAADRDLMREMSVWDVIQDRGFLDVQFARPSSNSDSVLGIAPDTPLAGRQTYRESRQSVGDNPLLIDAVPGMKGARRGAKTWADTGAKLNQQVEWQNRATMFVYLRKKGWSAEAASKKVDELQFDYSDLSQFEREVMRRAAPFYSFTRKVTPMIVRHLLERPGGAWGQTIRASNAGKDDTRPMPEYLQQTASVPLGEMDDGTQRFLAGFGLAHEVPLSFLGDGVRGAGMGMLGMVNPLVKGPLEYATGESFFQRGPLGGRDLDDLDPTIGRLLTNIGMRDETASGRAAPLGSNLIENLIANSPLSRLATTARTLTDSRKYEPVAGVPGDALMLNLLTGARISDLSPASSDAVLRETAGAVAKEAGARSFESIYFPKKVIDEVRESDPQKAAQMEAYNALRNVLARKAKARAAAAKN